MGAVEAAKTITSTSNETKQQVLLMKKMKQMQGSQQFHHPPLQKEGNHIFLGEFHRINPPEFAGSPDPLIAQGWLK